MCSPCSTKSVSKNSHLPTSRTGSELRPHRLQNCSIALSEAAHLTCTLMPMETSATACPLQKKSDSPASLHKTTSSHKSHHRPRFTTIQLSKPTSLETSKQTIQSVIARNKTPHPTTDNNSRRPITSLPIPMATTEPSAPIPTPPRPISA